MMASEIVAPSSETARAGKSPGEWKPRRGDVTRRTTNAASGHAR